jgi:RNA polymerase-associated protein CTR9
VHFRFNVAFVQIQLATAIYGLGENQRALQQLRDAAAGLEEAITTLDDISAHPQAPYPKQDIEQRANMARNTQRKQLERAIAGQKEYEEKNKEKLAAAMEQRQIELRRRTEEREKALQLEKERQEKIRKEREEIAARDRQFAEQRAEEARQRREAELTTDSETGEKVKRKRKAPSRPDGAESRGKGRARGKRGDDNGNGEESEEERIPKKRRLTKKESSKYKSAEIVMDSSDDSDTGRGGTAQVRSEQSAESPMEVDSDHAGDDEDGKDEVEEPRQTTRRLRRGKIVDESDEDEDGQNQDQGEVSNGGNDDEDY